MTEVVIDLNSIRTENPDITMGDLFKNHIVPALPNARYFDKIAAQVIVLPWADGKYADDWNPCIVVNAKTSDKLANVNQATCQHGIINSAGSTYAQNMSYIMKGVSSGSSGDSETLYFSSNELVWREHQNGNTRCYGLNIFNNHNNIILMSMNVIVIKARDIKTDEEVNVELEISTSGSSTLNYVIGASVYSSEAITRWNLPTRENSISAYQLNNGIIYSDDIFIGFPMSHTLLKDMCTFSEKSPHESKQTTWNNNALNIKGINFDIKLSSASTDTSVVWMLKHQDN